MLVVRDSPFRGNPEPNLELPDSMGLLKPGRNKHTTDSAKLILKEYDFFILLDFRVVN